MRVPLGVTLPRSVIACVSTALFTPAFGAISPSERAVLDALYTQTDGAGWSNKTGWGGATGTECSWYGISCDQSGSTVTSISLGSNNLVGKLPANLAILVNLQSINVSINLLTGPIPSLTGLTNLQYFNAYINGLSGPLPSLSGLTNLFYFDAAFNYLSGSIPPIAGLNNLATFRVSANHLSGSLPSLSGLSNLGNFDVTGNQLTGSIPSLAGLDSLLSFHVSNNLLTGAAPSVPSPINALIAGHNELCPNLLTSSNNTSWNVATGATPWYTTCVALPTSYVTAESTSTNVGLSPALQTVAYGSTATFTLTIAPGYIPIINSGCGGTLNGTSFTTGPATYNCTVKADFEIDLIFANAFD